MNRMVKNHETVFLKNLFYFLCSSFPYVSWKKHKYVGDEILVLETQHQPRFERQSTNSTCTIKVLKNDGKVQKAICPWCV